MSNRFMAKRRKYTVLVRNDEETTVEDAYEAIRRAFGYDVTQTTMMMYLIEEKGQSVGREYTELERAEFALQTLLKAGMDAELLQI